MIKEGKGHYRAGIYHARKVAKGWEITVEDGRGLPFDPITLPTLGDFKRWVGD